MDSEELQNYAQEEKERAAAALLISWDFLIPDFSLKIKLTLFGMRAYLALYNFMLRALHA